MTSKKLFNLIKQTHTAYVCTYVDLTNIGLYSAVFIQRDDGLYTVKLKNTVCLMDTVKLRRFIIGQMKSGFFISSLLCQNKNYFNPDCSSYIFRQSKDTYETLCRLTIICKYNDKSLISKNKYIQTLIKNYINIIYSNAIFRDIDTNKELSKDFMLKYIMKNSNDRQLELVPSYI